LRLINILLHLVPFYRAMGNPIHDTDWSRKLSVRTSVCHAPRLCQNRNT